MQNRFAQWSAALCAAAAVTAVAAGATNCKSAIPSARALRPTDALQLESSHLDVSSRGQFEKTGDYKRRILEEQRRRASEARKTAESFGGTALFKYVLHLDASYDADHEIMSASYFLPATERIVNTGSGKRSFFEFDSKSGETRKEPYLLNTTKASSDYFGVLYTTALSTPLLHAKRAPIRFRLPIKEAKRVIDQLDLVIAGRLAPPYVETSYYHRDDWSTMTMNSDTITDVVLDVSCGAIVDHETGDLLFELH